ncbi:MAG: hypothetical protein KDD21_11490 [Bacteroidetes bacterium]|nr:hypothetical protein [Bacteroidota bacterium]
MKIYFRYQEDVYRAKFKIIGTVNYQTYQLTLTQTDMIYGDLLPKGLQWCMGKSDELRIYRSSSVKKLYLDGNYVTACDEVYRMVLFKE